MPRGITEVDKMIYKGTEDEFIVIVDSLEDLEKWKTDPTVPMARVVGSFNVFTTFRYVAFSGDLLVSTTHSY
jgi:hypothetical protein